MDAQAGGNTLLDAGRWAMLLGLAELGEVRFHTLDCGLWAQSVRLRYPPPYSVSNPQCVPYGCAGRQQHVLAWGRSGDFD